MNTKLYLIIVAFILTGVNRIDSMIEPTQEDFFLVITSDNLGVPISKAHMQESPTVHAAFSSIPYSTLTTLLPLIELSQQTSNLENHLKQIEKQFKYEDCCIIDLDIIADQVQAAQSLGLTKIVDSYALFLATKFPELQKCTFEHIAQREDILNNFAKFYFLKYRKELKHPKTNTTIDFNVSLQDLYDYKIISLPHADAWEFGDGIDVSGKHLNSLTARVIDAKWFYIKELLLGRNNFSEFPLELTRFTQLKTLSLACNKLITLPAEITKLRKLRYLDLDDNQLTELPENFGELKKLESLYLRGNPLKTLPGSMVNLDKLHVLILPKAPELIPAVFTLAHLKSIDFDLHQNSENMLCQFEEKIVNYRRK